MLTRRRRREPPADPETVVFVRPPAARGRVSPYARSAVISLLYGGWSLGLAFSGAPAAGALAVLVWAELGLIGVRMASVGGAVVVDEEVAARVAPALRELCGRVGHPVPRVVLRSDAIRAAAIRPGRGRPTLVLSCPFVRRLDDAALRALLAHEVAHTLHGDLGAGRRRALVAVAAAAVVGGAMPVLVPGPANIPIWVAAAMVVLYGVFAGLAPSNRPREARADEDAARLCGDPAALVRVLEAGQKLSEETRARLLGPQPLRTLLAPVAWRMPTHPPIEQRIARLEGMPAIGAPAAGAPPPR